MRDFQSKKRFNRILESRPVLLILFLGLVFSAWNLLGFWSKMNETAKNREFAEEKFNTLRLSKEKLESNLGSLETDRGVEEVLREDFGLAREGEGVIVILEDETTEAEKEPKRGFWGFWKGLFR